METSSRWSRKSFDMPPTAAPFSARAAYSSSLTRTRIIWPRAERGGRREREEETGAAGESMRVLLEGVKGAIAPLQGSAGADAKRRHKEDLVRSGCTQVYGIFPE